MSAVTGGMEQGPLVTVDDGQDGLSGLGSPVKSEPRDLGASHTQLTKTHWLRSVLATVLRSVRFRHEWDGNRLVLRIIDAEGKPSAIPEDAVPWQHLSAPMKVVKVWGFDNGKMDCPVFDLPTGSAEVYGTCPGAREGQSISATRPTLSGAAPGVPEKLPVNLPATICQSCYAEAGNMAMADNQLRYLIRYVWTAGMVNQHYADFVDVMVRSLLAIPEEEYGTDNPEGILPVRLHGGGDFFSQRYASAWVDIANVLAEHPKGHRIRIWAPTRTWAVAGWTEFWQEELLRLKMLNFIVRPSAFHFSDPAPRAFLEGSGEGSTSMFVPREERAKELARTNFYAQGREKLFFDWRCPVYAARNEVAGQGCRDVVSPMGTKHCRACWIRHDMRIDYPAH